MIWENDLSPLSRQLGRSLPKVKQLFTLVLSRTTA